LHLQLPPLRSISGTPSPAVSASCSTNRWPSSTIQPERLHRGRDHKGNYSETLNAGIAAFRAGEQPDILQVFEVGTAR
jgi:hypothetical protein